MADELEKIVNTFSLNVLGQVVVCPYISSQGCSLRRADEKTNIFYCRFVFQQGGKMYRSQCDLFSTPNNLFWNLLGKSYERTHK